MEFGLATELKIIAIIINIPAASVAAAVFLFFDISTDRFAFGRKILSMMTRPITKRINPVMLNPEISLPKVLPYQNKNEKLST